MSKDSLNLEDTVVIDVKNVSKSFILPHEKNSSIKSLIINPFKKRTYENQEVLRDVSFSIKEGEFFGIVGRNGSGKSTLLKLLAGIYSPNSGEIEIKGKLTPFIELGVGFNPELTGRENVYLNGALLGFNRKDMDEMYDEIVQFAELEKFMDQKLKNYSSGMQVRLAFSIAIRAKSDILLIDEVLAVGDSAFQRKCYEIFTELRRMKRTIVFVTHDMSAVERFCDRVAVVHKGELLGVFKPKEASLRYDQLNVESAQKVSKPKSEEFVKKNRWGTSEIQIKQLKINDTIVNKRKIAVEMGNVFELDIELDNPNNKEFIIGLRFDDGFGVNIAGPNSINQKTKSKDSITYHVDRLSLLPGDYKLTVVVFDKDVVTEYDHFEEAASFVVTARQHDLHGKVNFFGEWK